MHVDDVFIYLKYLPHLCTKMNDFKFDFTKNFWGGAHRAPSPDPSPVFSRTSPSVRASPSILGRFAASTLALPSTFDRRTLFGPPKINSWIRNCSINQRLFDMYFHSLFCLSRLPISFFLNKFVGFSNFVS